MRFSFGVGLKEVHGQVREGTTYQEWHLVRLSEGKRDCTPRAYTLNKIPVQLPCCSCKSMDILPSIEHLSLDEPHLVRAIGE